jgi:hypothetical protein
LLPLRQTEGEEFMGVLDEMIQQEREMAQAELAE